MKKITLIISIIVMLSSICSCGAVDTSTEAACQLNENTSVTTEKPYTEHTTVKSTQKPVSATEKNKDVKSTQPVAAVPDIDNSVVKTKSDAAVLQKNLTVKQPADGAQQNSKVEEIRYNPTYYTSTAFDSGYFGMTPLYNIAQINTIVNEEMRTKIISWLQSAENEMPDTLNTKVDCKNGYLFIDVYSENESCEITDVRSVIFDLYSNKQLELKDIFYNTDDYMSYCNNLIKDVYERGEIYNYSGSKMPVVKKGDFTGLDDKFSAVTCLGIYIYPQNPYIQSGLMYNMYCEDEFILNNSIIFSEPRNMDGIFTKDVVIREDKVVKR